MRLRRRDLRLRVQLFVIGAVALTLAVLIGAFNVVLRERLSHEADSALFARASAELGLLPISDGRLSAPEAPDAGAVDTRTWVFAAGRALEQPPSDPITARAAASLSGGTRRTEDIASVHVRLLAVPVLAGARRLGSVVTAESLRPYESTAHTALIASLILAALVLAVISVATRLVVNAALRPVAQMTSAAAAWSEADTGQRFGLGPPRDELTQLGATLDQLLDRVATSLRHEQRFSAELSHELRTPLASMIAEAQLALRHDRRTDEHRAGYERVLASARQMQRTLDTLVTAARLELAHPRGTGDATDAIHSAPQGYQSIASERGVTISLVDPEPPIRIGVETEVAERVLAPLIENACRHSVSSVTVAVSRSNRSVEFHVNDDGPGVSENDRQRIFDPGFSAGHGSGSTVGAGDMAAAVPSAPAVVWRSRDASHGRPAATCWLSRATADSSLCAFPPTEARRYRRAEPSTARTRFLGCRIPNNRGVTPGPPRGPLRAATAAGRSTWQRRSTRGEASGS
jgi:signal transduction histidine kinase